jgi:hypothetical protein
MKTKLFLTVLLSFVFYLLSSQVPQGFNYQAIARDGSGTILPNQALPVKIALQTSLTGGTLIYEESFPSITSNQFGLISLVVGTGTRIGGSAASFSAIDWKAQTLFLKTTIQYPGTTWTVMGTNQVWGVPYSLVAKDVEGPIAKLGITGTTDNMEEALFEVKNKAGNTVFAVYNEGIRAYVGNGSAKGAKGGFAVGGYDATKGSGTIFNLFTLNTDSARFYIDSKPNLKGKKGGFSVGGYDMSKTGEPVHDYLDVSKDSVRIYVDSNPLTKGKKGGFSVGGYDMTKGGIPTQDYMHVSKDSVRIYIDSNPLTKGVRGGFSVGGYDLTKGTPLKSYMRVTTDSTRVYVSNVTKTGSLGGFAVKPVTAVSEKTDFFNITSAPTAEVIKNESRIMWYPAKSALIGGEVHVGSADSVGQNSTALGYRSIAKGSQSQAFGYRSIAYGSYSTAIGYRSESNNNGMAVGYLAKASGSDAFALGSGATASANKSFAFGSVGIDSLGNITGNTKATGDYAYAFGLGSIASGKGAFALGANDTASGQFSYAAGYKSKASQWYSTSMGGYSQATGYYAVAMGYKVKASGTSSTSFGHTTEASGPYSTATGYLSKASGFYSLAAGYASEAKATSSIALGYYNVVTSAGNYAMAVGRKDTASGSSSFAAGRENKASGQNSFVAGYQSVSSGTTSIALGYLAKAAGNYSFAQGNGTTATGTGSAVFNLASQATGQYSIAAGNYTTAQSFSSLVIGRYNVVSAGYNASSWVFTDPAFVIGNGTGTTPANCFTVLKNGNTAIGSDAPTQMLDVNGNARIRSIGSGAYAGAVNRTSDGTLTVATSDIRTKENINTLTNCLSSVLNLRGISFYWKSEPQMGRRIGFVAQEVEQVLPELVFTNPSDGLKGVNYPEISAVLVEAIKEQQKQISNQNEQIESQKQENLDLKARLNILEKRIDEMESLNHK